jgi:Xaa-Pro aminopeptidase
MEDYRHPLLQKRDQLEFQHKLQSLMDQDGIDALIVLNPQHIHYATGYLSKSGAMPGLMPGLASVAMVPRRGEVVLFIVDLESEEARLQTRNVEVVPLPTFFFVDDGTDESRRERNVDFQSASAIQLAANAALDCSADPLVGVEMGALSHAAAATVMNALDPEKRVDCSGLLAASRKIKTVWEIDILRLGARFWDRVVRTIAPRIQPGMSLLELDALIMKTAWEMDTQHTLTGVVAIMGCGPLLTLCGLPRNYRLKEGDVVKLDGGGIHLGYTTDICRVWSVGRPAPAKSAVFDVLYGGFQRGMEMLKPGVKLSDMYRACRSVVEESTIIPSYPRGHVGHSISVESTLEDQPWITANEDSCFEPGMVVSHEMSYAATFNTPHEGSYNIEDTFLITEDGHERFSFTNETLEWAG